MVKIVGQTAPLKGENTKDRLMNPPPKTKGQNWFVKAGPLYLPRWFWLLLIVISTMGIVMAIWTEKQNMTKDHPNDEAKQIMIKTHKQTKPDPKPDQIPIIYYNKTDKRRVGARRKRDIPLLNWYHPRNPKTRYEQNTWYKYAQHLAKLVNKTNCYVCSLMPHTSAIPPMIVKPLNASTLYPDVLRSFWADGLLDVVDSDSNRQKPYSNGRNFSQFLSLNWTTTTLLTGINPPELSQFDCVYNNVVVGGSVKLGRIRKKYCRDITTPCSKNTNGTFKDQVAGVRCVPYFYSPDLTGTYPQRDVYYLCGDTIHIALPVNWEGRCALVDLLDGSYVVDAQPAMSRSKRSPTDPHDSIYGSNVPASDKLWSTGQKVILSLFPQLGVAKVMLRLETVNYRMSSFINHTVTALEGLSKEVSDIREMELQNRVVLDLLTADKGGVCALIGDHCCTYIVDETGSEGNVTKAIQDLRQLAKTIAQDHVNQNFSLWDWFTSGSWTHILQKIGVLIASILVVLCIIVCCVVPVVKSLVAKTMTTVVGNVYVNAETLPEPRDVDGLRMPPEGGLKVDPYEAEARRLLDLERSEKFWGYL